MPNFENEPAVTVWPASVEEMQAPAARLAVCSLMNGSVSEAERTAVLRNAQRVGVTTLEFLHEHLLLGARGTSGGTKKP